MRKDAEWMVLVDERILELLRDEGPKSPSELTEHSHIRVGRQYLGDRCRMLYSYGLLDKHGRGVYAINQAGLDYLDEELDASELESESG